MNELGSIKIWNDSPMFCHVLYFLIFVLIGLVLSHIIYYQFKKNDKNKDDTERQIIERKWKNHNFAFAEIIVVFCIAYFWFSTEYYTDGYTYTKLGIWVSILGIIASIIIYRLQSLIGKKTDTVINAIDKNILDLQLIKQNQDLKETIEQWFNKNGDPEMMLFYFPYTLCPGFWNYADTLKRELQDLVDKHNIKCILIGPKLSPNDITSIIINKIKADHKVIGDGMFKNKMEKILEDKNEREKKETNIQPNEQNNGDKLAEIVQRKYNEAVNDINNIEKDHHRFKVFSLPPNENNLFSFSFVITMNNRRAQEIVILDTFNFYTSDLSKLKNHIGISSILDGRSPKESLEFLFKRPSTILIKNQNLANFIFSMFLEYSYKNKELKEFLDNNLYDENN